jgi:hypothetical protein
MAGTKLGSMQSMRTTVVIASFLLVMGTAPTVVGQTHKTPPKAPIISQERLEGFYLEMPTTYLLPKEIQWLIKATIQGKTELEDRYSKLYTDKIRLGNLILVQVEAIRDASATKLKKNVWDFEREMDGLKADPGVKTLQEVRDRLAEDEKVLHTRNYPPGYNPMQVTKLHLEASKLNLVLTYDKVRNDTQKDLDGWEVILAFTRDWIK